jgi:hypothetical protein
MARFNYTKPIAIALGVVVLSMAAFLAIESRPTPSSDVELIPALVQEPGQPPQERE